FVRAELARSNTPVSSADPWWAVVSEVDTAAVAVGPNSRLTVGLALAGTGLVLWAIAMLGVQRFKRAAHDATQRARQLAQVVEQTSDVVFITDPKGRISYVNPAFSAVTGYSEAEAKAQTPAILKSGQHPDDFYAVLWARLNQGLSFRDLFINRRRDGTLFYEEKTISPLTDEGGRIVSYVSTGKDITESKVTRLAFYDQLTGLVNRSLFLDRLQNEIVYAGRTGQHIAVLYMDLDGFKAINDTLGHDAGDAVLKEFALRVGALMRKSDTLARLGGDEFAVLLKEVDGIADVEAVAAKIVATVMSPWRLGERQPVVGVSIGISLFPSENVDSLNLLARADSAMYAAKRSGSNRYVVFGAEEKA
ncbi:MAG: diguanylate cyclase, partial [Rhodocyclales bacterium]|nr:diguanylate cyclase [Rhodocyclales bacterium]